MGSGRSRARDRKPRALILDGERIEVRVRASRRARVWRLVAGPRHPLELVVPARVGDADIDLILESRRAWIRAQRDRLRELEHGPGKLGLKRPGFAPLAGGHVPVVMIAGAASKAELRGERLLVSGPADRAGEAIARWYRHEARRRIAATAAPEAERLGVRFERLAIRDQRTRWGSCSSSGTLSFNWRLVLAPQPVLDYVVVHELCHLREANHSPRFWGLLDSARPGWRLQAGWLREHASELQAFDPTARVLSAPGGYSLPAWPPMP